MTPPWKRIQDLVDKLARDVTSIVLVNHGFRLLPATIEKLRVLIADALGQARKIGEMHPDEPREREDDTQESIHDTSPGFPSVRPKPPKH